MYHIDGSAIVMVTLVYRGNLVIKSITRMYVCTYGGPGSSVGVSTDYGLDDPGLNPGEDEILRPSNPAVGSTQPPVKWVPGLSRW